MFQRKANPGQFRQAVEWGIEAGYRVIDTAACYKNEEEVGEGIANKIKQGFVTREDLFVTTKVNENSFLPLQNLHVLSHHRFQINIKLLKNLSS